MSAHVRRQPQVGEPDRSEPLAGAGWDNLPIVPDLVITVCGSAAGETCPAYLGNVMRAHWGVDDPAKATGSEAEIDAAFLSAYRILRARIEAFIALPPQVLESRQQLQLALDRMGLLQPE